jgi:hypothetical protein
VLAGAGGVNHEELVDLAKTLFKTPKDLNLDVEIPTYTKCRFTGILFFWHLFIFLFQMINNFKLKTI